MVGFVLVVVVDNDTHKQLQNYVDTNEHKQVYVDGHHL